MGKRVLIGVGVLVLVVLAGGGGYLLGVSAGEARANQAGSSSRGGASARRATRHASPTNSSGGAAGRRARGWRGHGTVESIEGDTVVVTTQDGRYGSRPPTPR